MLCKEKKTSTDWKNTSLRKLLRHQIEENEEPDIKVYESISLSL